VSAPGTLGAVGLLGKTAAQADFIRLNAPAPVVHHFHRWLEDGCSALPPAQRRFPPEPVCFAFTAAGERGALFGAMAASADSVGRQFPLCVFVQVDAAQAAARFAALPGALKGFLEGAQALIGGAATLDGKALAARLQELPAPTAQHLEEGEAALRQRLAEVKVAAAASAIGKEPPGAPHHAFRTFLAACARERGREPQKAAAVLDCPVSAELEPTPWLELSRRLLSWKSAPPSFFWMGRSRLLLSLGPPPPSVVGFLSNPSATSTKLWPLRAADPTAIAASQKALTAAQREALDQEDLPLEALFARLTA
jgi:type VI secretion system ImpM family protein